MKKRIYCFVFLFILFGSLFVSVTSATDLDSLQDTVGNAEDKVNNAEKLISDEDTRTDYIKTEWGKILAKNSIIGPVSNFYEKQKLAVIVDPVVKILTGLDTEVTWLFFLGLLLWVTLLIVVYQSIRYAGDYPAIATFLVSVGFMGVLGFFGLIERLAQFIIDTISVLSLWWVQLILGILVIVVLFLAIYFSKYIKVFMLAMKMKRKAQEGEEEKKSLIDNLKLANTILKEQNKEKLK